jgi:hypothetical protein
MVSNLIPNRIIPKSDNITAICHVTGTVGSALTSVPKERIGGGSL